MSDNYFSLSKDIQRDILTGAESKLNVKAEIIEKDIWICWVLSRLFTLPIKMAFKGGTSLSKAYNLIDRFSEDVDVTIDYLDLMPDIDLSIQHSRSQLKKTREALQLKVKKYVIETILPFITDCYQKEFRNDKLNYELSDDGEKLFINYPTLFDKRNDYLKSNVLIELGGCNSTQPNEIRSIKAILTEIAPEIVLPIAQVNVLSPLRTFWEKATLIHVECHRGNLKVSSNRLSRHWYDLAQLSKSWVGPKAIDNINILHEVLVIKKAFFYTGYANYEKCENKQFLLMPNDAEIKILKTDYNNMIDAGMFSKAPTSFETLIEEIRLLEEKINL